MTQKVQPFVFEQAIVTGTSNVSLTGIPVTGYFSFMSQYNNTDILPYIIFDSVTSAYEFGQGTFTTGNILQRTIPQGSSTGVTPYNFLGNVCNVYVGHPGPVLTSAGASSQGRIPMLNSSGLLDPSFFTAVSSGSVTINYGFTGSYSTPIGSLISNIINPAGFAASGSTQSTYISTAYAANTSTVVVNSLIDFAVNQGIYLAGAGISGAPLIAQITGINISTNQITFSPGTGTAIPASSNFNASFNGNYMTLLSVPSANIYPGFYCTFGASSSATIMSLYSGNPNTIGAVYATDTSVLSHPTYVMVTAYCGVAHDDTAAINNALSASKYIGANNSSTAVDCGGAQYNVSSPINQPSATVIQNFYFILAPGSAGNFYCIPQWQPWMAYNVGYQVTSNGNQYICTTAGTSAWRDKAGTGISGTGTGITDGTVVWNYVQAAQTVNAVLNQGNSSNCLATQGIIDLNRVSGVFGITALGTAGIKWEHINVRRFYPGNIGYYVCGKTFLINCQCQQWTSADFETNFPTTYFGGWCYFFDKNINTGGGGGGTDSYFSGCTSLGSPGVYVAAGTTHIRLMDGHCFPPGNATALSRSSYAPWNNNTSYTNGTYVTNGNYIYQCTTSGTSSVIGDGPLGTGTGIVDGSAVWSYSSVLGNGAWANNTAYTVGYTVSNFGQAYQCTTAGTSAASGTGPFQTTLYSTFKATGCSTSGTTLTVPNANVVSTPYTVTLAVGMIISATGISTGTYITAVGTNSGGNTTYTMSTNPGTMTNVTVTSESIPDGSVVWSQVGTAPNINPVDYEIHGGGVLISGTYLDTGGIKVYLTSQNQNNIIITGTNSLYLSSTSIFNSWITFVVGRANTAMTGIYISPDNSWQGGIPVSQVQFVNGGSLAGYTTNLGETNFQNQISSVMTTQNGLTVYETNPSTSAVLQLTSNYIDQYSNGYSLIEFFDPNTTSGPPSLGSEGNSLIIQAAGVTKMTVSPTAVTITEPITLTGQTTTTAATGGSATALPSQPLGYLETTVNGTTVKIPYYSV